MDSKTLPSFHCWILARARSLSTPAAPRGSIYIVECETGEFPDPCRRTSDKGVAYLFCRHALKPLMGGGAPRPAAAGARLSAGCLAMNIPSVI
nr:uncharacterized protein LOC105477403 isoform X6 [Macaca nemestrina]